MGVQSLKQLRVFLQRRRKALVLFASGLFFAGLLISVRKLGFSLSAVSLPPLLFIMLILTPLGLGLAAVNLQLAARALGKDISFTDAFAYSAIGRIAELTPAPGGALTRGAALIKAGAGLSESAKIIALTALLTLSMAIGVGGAPLLVSGYQIGAAIIAAGMVGAVASCVLISRIGGLKIAMSLAVIRVAVLVVNIARISAAFAVIGETVEPIKSALFVICATLGSAAAIVPAGLGVSELIAALLAGLIAISPAAAFLSVAVNRLAGLFVCGVIAAFFLSGMEKRWSAK